MSTALAVVLIVATTIGVTAAPSGATPEAIQPQRILDTRSGLGAPAQRLAPGQVLSLGVSAAAAAGAQAVSINFTATDATGAGFLTAWPCGQPQPTTSVLNFVPGQSVANFISLGLGTDAQGMDAVCLAASAPTHVVADLMGWYADADDFAGAPPTRLLDTRVTHDRLAAGVERRLSLAAGAGYRSDASAVALNITVVSPDAAGFVVVYPCGPRPLASTVNYQAGEIVPNFTFVSFTSGEICMYSMAATDIVVDSFGWSRSTGGLKSAAPSRLLDTRSSVGASGPASPAAPLTLRVAGRAGVPNDAAAVMMTITATGGTANGYVTAWPCDEPRPVASILNLRPGLLRSNLALVRLSDTDGTACLYAYTVDGSPVQLVADAVGWVTGGPVRTLPPPDAPPPPAPPPGGGGNGYFGTLPVGAALPSDATCTASVRRGGPEIRPANATFNQTKGHATSPDPYPAMARVTGDFTGTTDEIIQWAACKWGYDEDTLRAQVAKESYWFQRAAGDFTSDASRCAPGHPIGADGQPGMCPESMGLLQYRSPPVDAVASSAYNLDLSLAVWRTCFEGGEEWLNTVERGKDYAAGDLWGCVGRWFAGRWYTPAANDYIAAVQSNLSSRIWETPTFINAT